MLSPGTVKDIRQSVHTYWEKLARTKQFIDLAQGKEIGHRIADFVDEKTASFIHANYDAAFEKNVRGQKKMRSMGDVWLKADDIYHPINIKTGISDTGQPNMVALRKLLRSILGCQIDSYYLLMIKFLSLIHI